MCLNYFNATVIKHRYTFYTTRVRAFSWCCNLKASFWTFSSVMNQRLMIWFPRKNIMSSDFNEYWFTYIIGTLVFLNVFYFIIVPNVTMGTSFLPGNCKPMRYRNKDVTKHENCIFHFYCFLTILLNNAPFHFVSLM